MTPEWEPSINQRKAKRQAKLRAKREETAKWAPILDKYPHIVPPRRARRLRELLGIDNLDKKLMSEEWIDYQKKGWTYVKALKNKLSSDQEPEVEKTDDVEFSILELENGWGDRVLFKRSLERDS